MTNIYSQIDSVLSAFVPLTIIALGLIFNTLCFLIFRFTSQFKRMSSMVYLSFVVIVDTLSLFDWNLSHYLKPTFNIHMEYIDVFTCKFFGFHQYYLLQASGFLLSFVSIDRFVSIRKTPGSIYSRLPFGTPKSAFFWSVAIMLILFIMNMHILILSGFYQYPVESNNTNLTYPTAPELVCNVYPNGFTVWPQWNAVHLFLYNFIPGLIMIVFNFLLIYTTLMPNKAMANKNRKPSVTEIRDRTKKKKLTVSLVVVTTAFIVLTFPSTIAWGYLSDTLFAQDYGLFLLHLVDHISFLNHVSMFFFTYITNQKFRAVVYYYFRKAPCLSPVPDTMSVTSFSQRNSIRPAA